MGVAGKANNWTPKPCSLPAAFLSRETLPVLRLCQAHLTPTPQSHACSQGSWANAESHMMESLLSRTGDADRIDFIKNKKFCQPSMKPQSLWIYVSVVPMSVRWVFFLIAEYLLGLSSKQIFMCVWCELILQPLLLLGHTQSSSLYLVHTWIKLATAVAYLQDLIQLLLPLLSGYQYIWSHSPPFISSLSLVHLASVSCWKYKGTLRSRCFLFLILTVWRVTTARGVIFCWPPMGEWLLGQLVFTPLGGKTTT